MSRFISFFVFLGLSLGLLYPYAHARKPLTVGVIQNSPIVYVDHEGTPRGLFVDILGEIARQENWHIQYIHYPWAECVERLKAGEIDLMTSIAFTPERSRHMDFARENLIAIWGQVYVKPDSGIMNIQDLHKKTVAVLKNGVNGLNFRKLIRNFGLECRIVEKADYNQVIEAVMADQAHAGVTNNVTGYILEQSYDIHRSPIMFEPLKLGFATPKGKHQNVRDRLDAILANWKQDESSFYYQTMDRHYGAALTTAVPWWYSKVISVGIVLLGMALIVVVLLRLQVGKKAGQLRISEEKYRLIFENSPLAVIHIDHQGKVTACNQNLAQIMGTPRSSLMGFDLLSNLEDPQMQAAIQQALKGEIGRYQGIYLSVSGQIKTPLNGYFGPFFTDEGKLAGAVGLFEDITDVHQVEQERRQLEGQLRQAQKMEAVGCLAGGIAHDFNNILSAIIGYTEMVIQDLPPRSPQIKDLEKVYQAGERARELVKQILAFSRQSEEARQAVRVQSIIKEALKLLRPSIPTTIDIQMQVDGECGPVFADPTQIHQIVINLCTNAYQAMGSSGGILRVVLEQVTDLPGAKTEDRAGNPLLKLSISDTGTGIPGRDLEKVFDPYFTTKPKGKGTGLGLSIVHSITRSLQGDIQVRSVPGQGTTFQVFLPVMDTRCEILGRLDTAPAPTGREHILMVDDDENVLRLHKTMLKRLGYRVTAFLESPAALTTFRRIPHAFDLVITDMTMPGLTGAELARRLMALRPDIPVIICTGYSELIDAEKAKKMGVKAYVMKPVIQGELARSVRRVLDSRESPAPTETSQ